MPIEVKPNTPIAEWFADSLPHGATELSVNSYHHQACYPLGSNLVPMAHAPDGIIEAFYDGIGTPDPNPKHSVNWCFQHDLDDILFVYTGYLGL